MWEFKMVALASFPILLGYLICLNNVGIPKKFLIGLSSVDSRNRTSSQQSSTVAILETRAITGCKKIIGLWKLWDYDIPKL